MLDHRICPPPVQLLCAEDELSRECWVRALTGAAAALRGRPMALSSSYTVHYQSLLGSGVFAVVVKASELHGRSGGVALKVCAGPRSSWLVRQATAEMLQMMLLPPSIAGGGLRYRCASQPQIRIPNPPVNKVDDHQSG